MAIQSLKKALHQNEVMLQGLEYLTDQGILTTDTQLNIRSWNHWLEIHTGLSAKEVIGRNLLKVYPELTKRRLVRFYEQALAGQVVLLSQRLHGYLLPMAPSIGRRSPNMLQSVRIGPLKQEGHNIGTITVLDDVTERVEREAELQHQIEVLKHTESALLSTQAQLQHLLSSSPAVIYTRKSSGDGGVTFVSDNVTAKLGYRPQEFTDNPRFWAEHIHPDDAKHLFAIARHLFQHQYHVLEYRFLHKNGTYRWMRDEMKVVYNNEGNLQEIVGVWYDITRNKQAEEQVIEQAALLDITTDAIIVQDFNNQILFWNKGAEHLYGWTAAEALGKRANQLLSQKNLPQLEEARQTVILEGEWHGELHQVTKDGKEVIIENRWSLVRDAHNKPKSILAVNTDITQKKILEAQFLRIQRMESIGTLASGIAHDMNNLLTPILASAQLLQMELSPEKKQHLLMMMQASARRGANLVKQLLAFARGVEGKRTILQLGHLLREMKQITQQTFPKSIEVYVDIPQDLWPVSGDATQLDQVFMNLCVNARDAMPNGGKLSICAENILIDQNSASMNLDAKVGSYILITVSDTGTGIPPEIIDRIFEPFFTTKELGQGTGLGLSTVIGIIKSHGGFLNLDSQVGKGTQFQVYLPAVKENLAHKMEDIELPRGHGELILVVDDEASIREIAQLTLENYGYRVLTATNGIEGVALYTQYQDKISVVLLDMMMPSMDGPSTIRELQKINPSVKIIAISGLAFSIMVAEAADLGVKTFLSKPYTTEELLKIIRRVFSSQQ